MCSRSGGRNTVPQRQRHDIRYGLKIILCLLIMSAPLFAEGQLELYTKFSKQNSFRPIINYNGKKSIGRQLSVTFFGLIRENWSQALIGLSYSPSSWISLSSGMGIEHGKSSPRYSSSVLMKNDRTSLLLLEEWGSGKENYLYKVNLFHKYTEAFTFGFTAWRFHGLGPNFRFTIPKVQSTVWIMPAYEPEEKMAKVMLGLSFQM